MRLENKRNLEARKGRLAALLAAEDRIYEQEFNDNLETPEQVRDKMWERLQHLKGKREAEKEEEVARRMDVRFKTSNDSLRKED